MWWDWDWNLKLVIGFAIASAIAMTVGVGGAAVMRERVDGECRSLGYSRGYYIGNTAVCEQVHLVPLYGRQRVER